MKVKVIKSEHEDLWYNNQIDNVFCVEEILAYPGWYRLTGEYGEGARLLQVKDVEVVREEQTKFPFKVRCINATDWDGVLEVGKIYTAVGEYCETDYILQELKFSLVKSRFEVVNVEDTTRHESPARNKYMREVKPGVWVDVYDVIRAWKVEDPCLQHLLKKALASGQRGHKDLKEDLNDILASAKRAVEMHEEWNS